MLLAIGAHAKPTGAHSRAAPAAWGQDGMSVTPVTPVTPGTPVAPVSTTAHQQRCGCQPGSAPRDGQLTMAQMAKTTISSTTMPTILPTILVPMPRRRYP